MMHGTHASASEGADKLVVSLGKRQARPSQDQIWDGPVCRVARQKEDERARWILAFAVVKCGKCFGIGGDLEKSRCRSAAGKKHIVKGVVYPFSYPGLVRGSGPFRLRAVSGPRGKWKVEVADDDRRKFTVSAPPLAEAPISTSLIRYAKSPAQRCSTPLIGNCTMPGDLCVSRTPPPSPLPFTSPLLCAVWY